jgi:hypothetical protein
MMMMTSAGISAASRSARYPIADSSIPSASAAFPGSVSVHTSLVAGAGGGALNRASMLR